MLKLLTAKATELLTKKIPQKWTLNVTKHFEERFLLREESARANNEMSVSANAYLHLDEEEKVAKAVAFAARQATPSHRDQKFTFVYRDGKKVIDRITVVLQKRGLNVIDLITWFRPDREVV